MWLSTLYNTLFTPSNYSISSRTSDSGASNSTSTTSTTSTSILNYDSRTSKWVGNQLEEINTFGTSSNLNDVNLIEKEVTLESVEELTSINYECIQDGIEVTTSSASSINSTESTQSTIPILRKSPSASSRLSSYSNLSGPLPSHLVKYNTPRIPSAVITDRAILSSPFPAPLPIYTPTLIDSIIPASLSPSRRSFKKLEKEHEKGRMDWAYGTTSFSAKNTLKYCLRINASRQCFSKVVGQVGEVDVNIVSEGTFSRASTRGSIAEKKLKQATRGSWW